MTKNYEYYKGFKIKIDNENRYSGLNITKCIIDKYKEYISSKFSKTKIIYYHNMGINHNIRQHGINDNIIDLYFDAMDKIQIK